MRNIAEHQHFRPDVLKKYTAEVSNDSFHITTCSVI